MALESRHSGDKRVLWRESFTINSITKNHGVCTDITFNPDGIAVWNGATSRICYGKTNDFTTSNFSYRIRFKTSYTAHAQVLVYKHYGGVSGRNYHCYMTNAGVIYADMEDDIAPKNVVGGIGLNDGEWHELIVSADFSGNMELFIDGVSIDTEDISAMTSISNDHNFDIGYSDGTLTFNGEMELLEVWGSKIVVTEAALLFSNKLYTGFVDGGSCILHADYTRKTSLNWKNPDLPHTDTDIVYKHGLGAEFNGATSVINYGNTDLFNFGTGDFAIEFVCREKTSDQTLVPWSTIYSRGVFDGTGLLGYHYAYFRNINELFWYYNGGGHIDVVVSDITQLNHYVLRRIGDRFSACLNGVEKVAVVSAGINLNAAKLFVVGARELTQYFLDGHCPYMRVYKGKGLSDLEVRQNYQAAVDSGYLQ